MKAYHVTTLDRATNGTFVYQVIAKSERDAKAKVIAGIEVGSKKGSTVYEVIETDSAF